MPVRSSLLQYFKLRYVNKLAAGRTLLKPNWLVMLSFGSVVLSWGCVDMTLMAAVEKCIAVS